MDLFNYFFWILAGGQTTFFRAISPNDIVITVFVFFHSRMKFIVTIFADAYGNIVPIIDMM